MEVDDVGRWRFCPACGKPRSPPDMASEDQDDDHFDFEAVRCSGCERPWIACCCEPCQASVWQAIETVPKDGSWVVLKGGRPDASTWYSEYNPMPPCVIACWAQCGHSSDWFMAEYDGGEAITYNNPTHWKFPDL